MNRIKISAIVLSFVILSGCDAVPTGDARIGWFPARLSGDIALDAQSGSGRNLDVVRADVNDDLGLGRSGNVMAGAAIDSPLGRVRRRAEALPALAEKFAASLPGVFGPKQCARIRTLFDDPERLDALPVHEFMAALVRN